MTNISEQLGDTLYQLVNLLLFTIIKGCSEGGRGWGDWVAAIIEKGSYFFWSIHRSATIFAKRRMAIAFSEISRMALPIVSAP